MAEVSVVIPVYNKEKYIRTLLDQLSAQTFADAEIICVDNNSTDASAAIIAACAENDGRICLIREPKQGVSAARNAGIAHSAGRYLIFCDADDEVEPDYLATLAEGMAGHEADVVAAGYRIMEGDKVIKQSPTEAKETLSSPEAIGRLFQCRDYQGYLWNKIFDAAIIRNNGLLFDEGISHNEDRLFLVRFLLCASQMTFIDHPVYSYCLREDSATHDEVKGKGAISERAMTEFDAFERMAELILTRSEGDGGEPYRAAYDLCIHDMILSELRMFRRMVGIRCSFDYRKSRMRYFARQSLKYNYIPSDETEGMMYRVYRRYAMTGLTFTLHAGEFVNVGVLE